MNKSISSYGTSGTYGTKNILLSQRMNMKNKSHCNSSLFSNSTMMSQNESYLLTNLRKNKSTIQFQKNCKIIKNKIFRDISNKIKHSSYKNLIHKNKNKNIIRNNLFHFNITEKSSFELDKSHL